MNTRLINNFNVKELLFIIPLYKKDKAFCFCLWPFLRRI